MKTLKRFFPAFALALASLTAGAQAYWNQGTQLMPLRLPVGERPEFLDLNGDGRQDAVKSYIYGDIAILWLDEDGNMKEGDIEGDTVNDCLLVDRNRDGKYDLIFKWADQTGNGKADLNLIIEYPRDGIHNINYMYVFDDDGDGVFNFFDWNIMTLACWEKHGISDFYTDYSGNSTFLKTHRKPDGMQDLRFQWENPFIFYDYDGEEEDPVQMGETLTVPKDGLTVSYGVMDGASTCIHFVLEDVYKNTYYTDWVRVQ